MTSARPITMLIAALGGEGGGVLTQWIVSAAAQAGFPVQSTSIPGVAQRTGATTYYVEILPTKIADLNGKRPVLALTPGVGDIDIAVASELLESGRTVANGFVTPDRTHVISSLSRFYAMDEKIAMGDGRFDQDKLIKIINEHAKDALLVDMDALAKQSGSIINAVMLGAIAGCGRLPLSARAIRGGHSRGWQGGRQQSERLPCRLRCRSRKTSACEAFREKEARPPQRRHSLSTRWHVRFPPSHRRPGSKAYGALSTTRMSPTAGFISIACGPSSRTIRRLGAQGRLLKEVARHLAVRMSYEDVVRVAQAKIAPARMQRIAREELRTNGEPFSVHDFLKPGIEELCQLLPSFLARPILRLAERKGWLGRVYFGMEINSTSISGYLRFWLLAKLRVLRPYGHRYKQEQQQIDNWLWLIREAAKHSAELALEVAECARLIKGYGDTHARGLANYRAIETRVIRPALAGQIPIGACGRRRCQRTHRGFGRP